MAFGGFGGFGSNNNQNQTGGGFGGFGASTNNNNNAGGFGSGTSGFGASTNNTGGGLFGANNNNSTTSTGFGGFGNAANNAGSTFGSAAKPAFGAPATGGTSLFGGGATTNNSTGFGGFGANTNTANNNANTSFGGSTMFGGAAAKPAFGATNTTGGTGLFGQSSTQSSTTGFGQTTGGFGQSTGFGQQNQAVNQGTGSTPFSAFSEKDTGANTTSNYQSITFMQPYQNFSFEELRLADYNAGRRFGNSNGQAGAFGQSTGFGGFGQNNNNNTTGGFGSNTANTGGLFGANSNNNATTNTQSPFGQSTTNNNTTSAFGGGGGLFGQNKPAGGGLFGATPASSSTTTGGLFGTTNNNNTSGGFGGFGATNNNNSTTTGGGLFGQNNQNQTQNKPFGGFGSNPSGGFGGSTTSGFGSTNNNASGGTGLFGASTNNTNTATGGFGQQNNQQTTSAFGGFGANNNQAQSNTGSGSLFGSFGQSNNANNNQQKPGGLFGSSNTNTGGGLFGNNNNAQQQSGGLFGNNNNNNNQSGGLFGNKTGTGTSLFGGNTNNTANTGGGLFGQNNQAQNSGGLFGQNNNQQKSMFGGSTNNNNGGGLFGGGLGQNNQNSGNSLFGTSQQNQAPAGNSLFGGSQQNQQQQPQALTASLMQNPYGNDQLFAGLGTPSAAVGPLATPLSGAQKPASRPSIVPAFKINPTASMRLITPSKRPSGYGFTYSTYGTPGSAQSFTPGRTSSILGSGGVNRALSKSLSTSNLRSPLSTEESVLAPGVFTPNYRPYSSGNSIRRLKIDRSLRTDLFGEQGQDRPNKRVSFDANGTSSNGLSVSQSDRTSAPGPNNALVRTDSDGPEPSSEELGLLRSARAPQKEPRTNGSLPRPEMEQVRGNELAIVPEDEQVPASAPTPVPSKSLPKSQSDQEPGEYYMIPSLQELQDMPRGQLKSVEPFTVGRVGIGKVEFSKVDLNTVPLDQIMGQIVKLNLRSATVYETGPNTPPEGKGLNVPSIITLENSWPRSNGGRLPVHERKGPRFEKHIERLKRVDGAEFISYSAETGEWVFRVQHFTTYGLDDDEEDNTVMDGVQADVLATPTRQTGGHSRSDIDMTMSPAASEPDDTFEFKKGGKTVPGGFGAQPIFDDDAESPLSQDEDVSVHNVQMEHDDVHDAASQSLPSPPATDDESAQVVGAFSAAPPKSILKNAAYGTPTKQTFNAHDDWADRLQRTVSPRKQDRRALRTQQEDVVPSASISGRPAPVKAFNTTMDIMNSLWNPSLAASTRGRSVKQVGHESTLRGDQSKSDDANIPSDPSYVYASKSVKPRWTADGTLAYELVTDTSAAEAATTTTAEANELAGAKDARLSKIKVPQDVKLRVRLAYVPKLTGRQTYNAALSLQLDTDATEFRADTNDVPQATTNGNVLSFAQLAQTTVDDVVTTTKERQLWQLTSILFDPLETACAPFLQGIPKSEVHKFEKDIRRDAVLAFWREISRESTAAAVRDARGHEEKALAHLSGGDIESACATLVQGKNLHLAAMVARLPSDAKAKEVMKQQTNAWKSQNSLSEFSTAIRALYELIAGNCGSSEGKAGAAEDRAASFNISEYFGLDWKRSLGLRLFYGDSDLAAAVRLYFDDLNTKRETVQPCPRQTIEAIKLPMDGFHDGLLTLLELYASQSSSQKRVNVEEILHPVALTGNPLDARIGWQLATLLRSKGVLNDTTLPGAILDKMTSALALQLEAENTASSVLSATSVLLHLSSPADRKAYVQDLLHRRASLITLTTPPFATDAKADVPLQTINKTAIPESWLHIARARFAASRSDYSTQAAHLILAQDFSAAHKVLAEYVGPEAVISEDYDSLRELLGHFMPEQAQSRKKSNGTRGGAADITQRLDGWKTGGQLYFDFVHLIDLQDSTTSNNGASKRSHSGEGAIRAVLMDILPALAGVRTKDARLEVRVAVTEMSRVVREAGMAVGLEADLGQEDRKRFGRLQSVGDDGFVGQGERMWELFGRALEVRSAA